ncbi:MAG: hypothetical protein RLY57_616 [Candidatus Parcubacteria bacterium]|jgi:hypothetical protein
MGKYLTSFIGILVIISQLAIPFAYAQELPQSNGDTGANSTSLFGGAQVQQQDAQAKSNAKIISNNANGSQAQVNNTGVKTDKTKKADSSTFTADAVGCSVGQIAGGIVRAGISGLINEIKGEATSEITDEISGLAGRYVPTDPQTIKTEIKNINKDTARTTSKEVGGGHLGLLDSLVESVTSISWDSIGFCLANATIQYLTQSTVNWINSGFEGNPTFVDNPGQFFQDMADIELGSFINELGVGFMCSGIAPKVRIAIVNDYLKQNGNKAFKDKYKCSFDKIGTNLEAFANNYKNGGINAFVELVYNPASTPSGAYLAAQEELGGRIAKKQGQAQFELRATDFLNYKKCDEVSDVKTRQIKKVNCKTYTPGQLIEQQANNAINSPRNRLEIADEFDEIVGALVNQLIKAALSEITTPGDPNSYNKQTTTDDAKTTQEINQVLNNSGYTGTGYTPAPPAKLTGTCSVSTTTVAVDEPLLYKITARGGNQQYIYDWLGSVNFPTSTLQSELMISFSSSTASTTVSARVKSGSKSVVVKCPSVVVNEPIPLQVSCAADDTSVSTGDMVTWKSTVSGGTGYYVYDWSGDVDPIGQTNQDHRVVYWSKGTKRATLNVVSGSQSKTVSCDAAVKVK